MLARAITSAVVSCALIAVLGGAACMVGWVAEIPRLTDWDDDGIAMLPNTAVAMMAAGVALLLLGLEWGTPKRRAWGVRALAGLTAAIGGLTLTQHVFGWNLGIDTLLLTPKWGDRAASAPGRIGPPASATYLILGSALLLATLPRDGYRRAASIAATVACVLPLVALAAYFYGADPLYSVPQLTAIARQTAILLLVLAVGTVLSIEDHGLGALVRKPDAGGTIVRRLLPVSVAFLLLTGWLEDLGAKRRLYDHAFGNAMLTVFRVVIFVALLWWTAKAVSQQVTRRRRVEAALSESEHRFRAMADSAPVLIRLGAADHGCTWVNRQWLQFVGRSMDKERGDGWTAAVHGKDLPICRRVLGDALAGGGAAYSMEYRLRRADGLYRWVLEQGTPLHSTEGELVGFVATSLDITDRKLAEEALRRSELDAKAAAEANAKFRAFFEQGSHFAGVMTLDGTLLEANRLSLEGCGYVRDAVIGMKFWDCGWWSRSPELQAMIREGVRVAAGGEIFRRETPYHVGDGSERFVDLIIAPVKDDAGRVLFLAPTGTDITEQKSTQDALRDANRMKDEFLATLSHELRTPMSAILGWVQVLRRAEGKPGAAAMPADVVKGLEVIERNARVQAQIIEDLLDMNRIASGKMRLNVQSIQIHTVVEAAVASIRPAAEAKGVRLQSVCETIDRDVRGDPNRLQQVFYNLLSNAVKFTPKGGTVQVACQRVNSHVEVSVSDTGVGIKPEFLPHVFERFRQQDASITRSYGGLGLGLGIVKNLVELHGGSVHVASEGEHRGTTFTVNLPISIAILPMPPGAPGAPAGNNERRHPAAANWLGKTDTVPARSQQLSGVTALVVDDEPDARELLRRLLEDHGATAVIASSADEALRLFSERRPDVLLSDIGMPGIDGYQLIGRVRKLAPEEGGRTPAIALTAFARSEDRTRSLQAGFDLHMSKPVETAELLASVANVVARGGLDGE